MKEDRRWSNTLGIILHPAISINNITYRGDINGYDIFRAVCAGFKDQPEVCKGDNVFDVVSLNEQDLYQSNFKGRVRAHHIVAAVILILVLNFLALCLYRAYSKKKMNEEL